MNDVVIGMWNATLFSQTKLSVVICEDEVYKLISANFSSGFPILLSGIFILVKEVFYRGCLQKKGEDFLRNVK